MAIGISRFMTGRDIPADDTRVLVAHPVGTGERVRNIYIDALAISRGTGFGGITGTPSSYPDQPNEINFYGLWVPDVVWTRYSGASASASTTTPVDSEAELDRLFKNLLFEWGSSGNEYFGGDASDDPIPAMSPGAQEDDGTTPDRDDAADKAEAAGIAQGGSMGPLGIVRWHSREVWCRTLVTDGDGKKRDWDSWNGSFNVSFAGPGYVIFGVVRYEHAAQTNFNVAFASNAAAHAKRMLMAGDLSRVQAYIDQDTGDTGDWLRTVRFGGDAYIEADTVKGENMKAYAKGAISIETPYRLLRM